jgi:hypothetical protein
LALLAVFLSLFFFVYKKEDEEKEDEEQEYEEQEYEEKEDEEKEYEEKEDEEKEDEEKEDEEKEDEEGSVAVVYIGNEVVGEYPLSHDGEFSINGGTNVLKIEDGSAYMLYADCPDGRCKNQGRVSIAGERITCLPNRVMIMVKEAE